MGTIAQELTRIQTAKADIKTAIEGKGVTVPSATTIDGYATLVGQIQTGGATEAVENDVNFYDYDGFRVASFTIAEAKALTQAEYNAILPPTHEGLTFQEWNWTLNDITTYNRRYIDIGANYITTDGKTRIKIHLDEEQSVSFYLSMDSGISVVVDYGDGTTSESTTGTNKQFANTYTSKGDYVITITPTQTTTGSKYGFVNNHTVSLFNFIYEINIGNFFTLANTNASLLFKGVISIPNSIVFDSTFMYCDVKQINIPKGNHSFTNNNMFRNVNSRLSFPKQIGEISGSATLAINTYKKLILPECITNPVFAGNSLQTNYWLQILSIPLTFQFDSSNTFFNNCQSLNELDIVQGWIPNYSMKLYNNDGIWSTQNMVDFFNKLGTTSNNITLTFGVNNLGKLTVDQKAIATNKGYTLA